MRDQIQNPILKFILEYQVRPDSDFKRDIQKEFNLEGCDFFELDEVQEFLRIVSSRNFDRKSLTSEQKSNVGTITLGYKHMYPYGFEESSQCQRAKQQTRQQK